MYNVTTKTPSLLGRLSGRWETGTEKMAHTLRRGHFGQIGHVQMSMDVWFPGDK